MPERRAFPPRAGQIDLAVVVVNYNVLDLLRACLSSVQRASVGLSAEVWVVDCGSTDASAEMVRAEFPTVRLIESGNVGYARGNNLALREIAARGACRYVLLLNPDTVLSPTALAEMIAFMDAHPDAGVAGPRLLLADGSLDLACRRGFPTPLVSLCHFSGLSRLFPRSPLFARYNLTFIPEDAVAEVDSVVGAFMLVRGEVLGRVGLLDEAFFMYGEDLDWALRIKRSGWKVYYNGRVSVLHHKRASSRQHSIRAIRAFNEAMLIFFRKHYARTTAAPLRWLVVTAIYLRLVVSVSLARWQARQRDRRVLLVALPAASGLDEG
jgi:GT2 family glycosyltransferase